MSTILEAKTSWYPAKSTSCLTTNPKIFVNLITPEILSGAKIGQPQWIIKTPAAPKNMQFEATTWTCASHLTSIASERWIISTSKGSSSSYTNMVKMTRKSLTRKLHLLRKWAKQDLMRQDLTNAQELEASWLRTPATKTSAASLGGNKLIVDDQ